MTFLTEDTKEEKEVAIRINLPADQAEQMKNIILKAQKEGGILAIDGFHQNCVDNTLNFELIIPSEYSNLSKQRMIKRWGKELVEKELAKDGDLLPGRRPSTEIKEKEDLIRKTYEEIGKTLHKYVGIKDSYSFEEVYATINDVIESLAWNKSKEIPNEQS